MPFVHQLTVTFPIQALKKLLKAAAEEQQQQTNRPEVAGSLSREEKPELKVRSENSSIILVVCI